MGTDKYGAAGRFSRPAVCSCIVRRQLVLPWVERDPRQGFHIEPGVVMFSAELVQSKIAMLKKLLAEAI